jgi:hypothetical protein
MVDDHGNGGHGHMNLVELLSLMTYGVINQRSMCSQLSTSCTSYGNTLAAVAQGVRMP